MKNEHWRNGIVRGDRSTLRTMCPSATMSAINPAWYVLEAKQAPVVRGRQLTASARESGCKMAMHTNAGTLWTLMQLRLFASSVTVLGTVAVNGIF
jgi:hypothetical protein